MGELPGHSGPRGLTFVLGQAKNQKRVILAGPSDAAGMAETGMMTGISFHQINVNLLSIMVTLPRLIEVKTMGYLEKKLRYMFYSASWNPVP